MWGALGTSPELSRIETDTRASLALLQELKKMVSQEIKDFQSAMAGLTGQVKSIEDRVAAEADTIASLTASQGSMSADDKAAVAEATARIKSMTAEISSKVQGVSAPTSGAVSTSDTAPGLVSAATNPVALAGVPATPPSAATSDSLGAAVPSTDFVPTETSPNIETSGPSSAAPGADAAAARGEPVSPQTTEEVLPADAKQSPQT